MAHIDYYFAPHSPWAYLGSLRFNDMVRRHGATVRIMAIDLGQVFPVSGGLPLAKRAPQRQAYRLTELARWREFLDMPLVAQPRCLPVDPEPASRLVTAGRELGIDMLHFAHLLGRALWAEERNIADPEVLEEIVTEAGLDPAPLFRAADAKATTAAMAADTDRAIAANVFGVPTYALDGELFWGQDRLDFLERALARRV